MRETSHSIEVETFQGWVRGATDEGLAIFRGVPFAQAPTGALRFKAPVAPRRWSGVLEATLPAAICPQPPLRILSAMGEFVGRQDEDCLTATIWAPLPLDRPRPVLVWLHGGALCSGGAHPWYEGAKLARDNDIVVVAPNYRLGALGFLCRAGLVEGNMGFLDQLRALEWVHENASCFGGDPRQMTLMGQSAGAASIACMLALPKARQLFQRAIFLSGGMVSLSLPSLEASSAVADLFCASLGIDPNAPDALSRLQAAPVSQILEAQLAAVRGSVRAAGSIMPIFSFAAVEGFPNGPAGEAALREGAAGIDALVGSTAEEMQVFRGLDPRLAELTPDNLPKMAEGLFGASWSARIEQARRTRPGATAVQLMTDAYTDQFVQGIRQLALAVAAGNGNAWLFRFDWSAPGSGFGACHCIDLPFVFGTFDAFKGAPMLAGGDETTMAALSGVMRRMIGRFLRSGSPAGPDVPKWRSFSRSQPGLMVFNSLIQHGWAALEGY